VGPQLNGARQDRLLNRANSHKSQVPGGAEFGVRGEWVGWLRLVYEAAAGCEKSYPKGAQIWTKVTRSNVELSDPYISNEQHMLQLGIASASEISMPVMDRGKGHPPFRAKRAEASADLMTSAAFNYQNGREVTDADRAELSAHKKKLAEARAASGAARGVAKGADGAAQGHAQQVEKLASELRDARAQIASLSGVHEGEPDDEEESEDELVRAVVASATKKQPRKAATKGGSSPEPEPGFIPSFWTNLAASQVAEMIPRVLEPLAQRVGSAPASGGSLLLPKSATGTFLKALAKALSSASFQALRLVGRRVLADTQRAREDERTLSSTLLCNEEPSSARRPGLPKETRLRDPEVRDVSESGETKWRATRRTRRTHRLTPHTHHLPHAREPDGLWPQAEPFWLPAGATTSPQAQQHHHDTLADVNGNTKSLAVLVVRSLRKPNSS